jgi:DNA-binding NarL/FixJ family response regulator
MKLSPRQLQITRMICEGFTEKDIACSLGIAVSTVKAHREKVYLKLEIHKNIDLSRWWFTVGKSSQIET